MAYRLLIMIRSVKNIIVMAMMLLAIDVAQSNDAISLGIVVDFNGPPVNQEVTFDSVKYTFEGTDHIYEGKSVFTYYNAKDNPQSFELTTVRHGIISQALADGKWLVKGYQKGDQFYPIKSIEFTASKLNKDQIPKTSVLKAKP
jgi:hypothetical protein